MPASWHFQNRIAACLWAWLAGALAAWAAPGQSFDEAQGHWAYQPIGRPQLPEVKQARRVQSPIDAFLLARLEQRNLSFAPRVDKRALLRRVYFDLIGLPPTRAEIETFERDFREDAFARVVERLLASPRYGERWGRHWLDFARYADTKDEVLVYGKDALRPFAYTYRDYVIRAFNADWPYDKFVIDQLAADRVEPEVAPWRLAALGFLTVGRVFDSNPHDQIDDQIDTATRGFLGLTVACARCHDHKYDAITMRDYYALYGVFASSERPYDLPRIEDPESVPGGAEFERQLAKARAELQAHEDAEYSKLTEDFRLRIGDYLVRAATTKPDLTETAQFYLSLVPEDFRPALMLRTRRLIGGRAVAGDRVFGPWAALMELPDSTFAVEARRAVEGLRQPDAARNARFNPLVVEALAQAAPVTKTNVAEVYGRLLRDIYEESKKPAAGRPGLNADQQELLGLVTSPESPVWFARRDVSKHMSRAEKDKWNGLVANLDKVAVNASNPPPARAMVVADLPEPYEPHIFVRGSPARLGPAVPRAFLRVLSGGEPRPFQHGSGRLELALAIASPTNPLTARVLVNRVWMLHFGEPLVASTSDFGTRSDPPSDPALLDWLAAELIRSGWSIKHLHRVMLLSSAYQQAVAGGPGEREPSGPHSTAAASGPDDTLLAGFPRRRLDLESMRDAMLAVAGRLDFKMGGLPVDAAGDPLNRRRTVYGLVDRQNLPDLYRAFDFAIPDQCVERRPRTTVPQQALFALNSPFVLEQARALAARSAAATAGAAAQRVARLFEAALGRPPTPQETASALRFVEAAGADQSPPPAEGLSAWEQLAQVLLISNESMFLD